MIRRIILFSLLGAAAVCFFCIGIIAIQGLVLDSGVWSSQSRTQIFLRIQGGTRIILEPVVPSSVPIQSESLRGASQVLRLRLERLGIQSVITVLNGRLVVDALGATMPTSSLEGAWRVGLLEFVQVGDQPLDPGTMIHTTGPTLENSCVNGPTKAPLIPTLTPATTGTSSTSYRTVMTGGCLRSASVITGERGQGIVQVVFNDQGARLLADYTGANINRFLAIVVDNQVVLCPRIISRIADGAVSIDSSMTRAEGEAFANLLKFGPLPFPVRIVEVTKTP